MNDAIRFATMSAAVRNGLGVGKVHPDLAAKLLASLAEAKDAGFTIEEWFAGACEMGWMVLRARGTAQKTQPVPTVQPSLF